GDSLSADIIQRSGQSWLVQLKNNTTGKVFKKILKYGSTLSSAEWIEEMPSDANAQLIPLDNFKAVQFSAGRAMRDDRSVTIAQAGAKPVVLANETGKILAEPSVLAASGSAFIVKKMPG